MKKMIALIFAALVASAANTYATDDNKDRAAKKAALNNTQNSKNIGANGNYKHVVPTSKGNRLKDSFTGAKPESIERNYKKQTSVKKGELKSNSNIQKSASQNGSYKHPQGL
ncbi:MAG: hypothetical protein NZ529_10065 [Cytophagaceae bacterium]|nr:hypothetical protein [Cytophagaceae bacterium]MDW8457129.1 hypothetical protein [Cytophagaceae bacterium]